jgi:ATP-dependent Zn protease
MSEPSKDPIIRECEHSIHEAAHIAAGTKAELVTLDPNNGISFLQFPKQFLQQRLFNVTEVAVIPENPGSYSRTEQEIFDDMVALYAGPMADQEISGIELEMNYGARRDLWEAENLASQIVLRKHFPEKIVDNVAGFMAARSYIGPLKAMFSGAARMTNLSQEQYQQQVDTFMEQAKTEAVRVVHEKRGQIEMIAGELRAKKTLNRGQIQGLLGQVSEPAFDPV